MKLIRPKFWNEKRNILSFLLLPFAKIYQFFFYLKYKTTNPKKFEIPILCIGNIYLGGTGKTPLSIEISKELKKRRLKPVIIKKFYRNQFDEQEMIKYHNQDLIQKKTRGDSILQAIKNKFNYAILDDGFQDFSIFKSFVIICFNSKQLIGNNFIIPAGPLREKIESIKRANIIVINGEKNNDFESQILNINNNLKIFYTEYVPLNIEFFKKKKLLAFSGIGENKNFFDLLKKEGLNIVKEISFPDHYKFSNKDIKKILSIASKNNLEVITTEKDYFRLKKLSNFNFKYLKLDLKIKDRDNFFNLLIHQTLK